MTHESLEQPAPLSLGSIAMLLTVMFGCGAVAIVLRHWAPMGWPALAALVVYTGFFLLIRRSSPTLPLLEVGLVYGFIVLVYTVAPVAEYIHIGKHYGPSHDFRLQAYQPPPRHVASTAWWSVLYLVGFTVAYLGIRRNACVRSQPAELGGRPSMLAAVLIFVLLALYFEVVNSVYDLKADNYLDSYVVGRDLPIFVQQVNGKLSQLSFAVNFMLLILLFCEYRRFRIWIVLFIGYNAFSTLSRMWSGSGLALLCMAMVLLYHHLVRPVRFGTVFLIGFLGVYGCIAYTLAREQRTAGTELDLGVDALMSSSSEFDGVFATTYDLLRHRQGGGMPPIPRQVYFSDLLSLIPQQFLPFPKLHPAIWYLESFYPEILESGGGRNFGAIPEAVIGRGKPQLIAFAALLGALLGFCHRWFVRRQDRFWPLLFYLWLCAVSYRSFRSSNFILLYLTVYTFLPLYVFFAVMGLTGRRPEGHATAEGLESDALFPLGSPAVTRD